MYDVSGGGDYIHTAIILYGISDEQLIQNLAPRLTQEIKGVSTPMWPPALEELEEGEEIYPLLLKLLSLLLNPSRKTADLTPTTLSLASMISCK